MSGFIFLLPATQLWATALRRSVQPQCNGQRSFTNTLRLYLLNLIIKAVTI
jgi:hypothetical protein